MAESIEQRLDRIEDQMVTKADIADMVRKPDIANMATRDDLTKFATNDDLERFATKEDLERFATKEDLERFATKEDLERFATKEDLERFARKDDLAEVRNEIRAVDARLADTAQFLDEKIERKTEELRCHVSVLFEDFEGRMISLIKGIDVRDRVSRLEERMDAVEKQVFPES